jgi:LysR family transcriptional regulator of gallate degradation
MFKLAAHEIDQAREEIHDEQGTVAARIAVGSMPLARTYIVPRAIAILLERYPGSRVRLADSSYQPLLAQLRSGAIDLMIGALRQPPPVDDVIEAALFSEPLSVVVRRGHPLAAARKPSIEMLAHQSWVLPARGTPTRQHFERIFTENGLTAPEPAVEASSLIAVRGLLLENDMATLISRHQVRYEETAGLLEAVKLDLGDTARPIGITTRENWVPTRLQAEFIAILREVCRERN